MNEILQFAVLITEPVQWSFGLETKVFVLKKKVLFTSHVKL